MGNDRVGSGAVRDVFGSRPRDAEVATGKRCRSAGRRESGGDRSATAAHGQTKPSMHGRTYGRVRSQLTQVYVQKSTTTTRARRPSGVCGSELSQALAPWNDAS